MGWGMYRFSLLSSWFLCKSKILLKINLIVKIVTMPNTEEDVDKLDHSHIADVNVIWYSHSGK